MKATRRIAAAALSAALAIGIVGVVAGPADAKDTTWPTDMRDTTWPTGT